MVNGSEYVNRYFWFNQGCQMEFLGTYQKSQFGNILEGPGIENVGVPTSLIAFWYL
jgi:hypothetical protein